MTALEKLRDGCFWLVLVMFELGVLGFSACMTSVSVYDAFPNKTLGGVFGFAAPVLFEVSIPYWRRLAEKGRELQVFVSYLCLFVSTFLTIASTAVGISILTDWGAEIRTNYPLGQIMIVFVVAGLANNIFGSMLYGMLEPAALKDLINRLVASFGALMEALGDGAIVAYGADNMFNEIKQKAPDSGKRLAGDAMDRAVNKVALPSGQPMRPVLGNPQPAHQFSATTRPEPKVEPYDPTSDLDVFVKEEKAPNPPAANKGPHQNTQRPQRQ